MDTVKVQTNTFYDAVGLLKELVEDEGPYMKVPTPLYDALMEFLQERISEEVVSELMAAKAGRQTCGECLGDGITLRIAENGTEWTQGPCFECYGKGYTDIPKEDS